LVLICYATIGLPLFMITTAKISGMLASIFKFGYKYIVLFPFVLLKKLKCFRKKRVKIEKNEEKKISSTKLKYFNLIYTIVNLQ
jgi:hypothetical protein